VQAFVHDFFAGRLTAHVLTAELGQPAGPPRPLLAAVPGDAEAAWASITAASFACAVLPGAACAAARRHWARPGNGGVQLIAGDAERHDVLVRKWIGPRMSCGQPQSQVLFQPSLSALLEWRDQSTSPPLAPSAYFSLFFSGRDGELGDRNAGAVYYGVVRVLPARIGGSGAAGAHTSPDGAVGAAGLFRQHVRRARCRRRR
jgi:hypothetical protein